MDSQRVYLLPQIFATARLLPSHPTTSHTSPIIKNTKKGKSPPICDEMIANTAETADRAKNNTPMAMSIFRCDFSV